MGMSTTYPRCWKRVSRRIRQLAGGQCERCGRVSHTLSVHHLGAPFANGTPGNSQDKHDIRRENLIALCFPCHDEIDHLSSIKRKTKRRKAKRAARRAAHQALGVGTGLVVRENTPTRQDTRIPWLVMLQAVSVYMQARRDQIQQCRIVDTTLVTV